MSEFDAGEYCLGYSCCGKESSTLMYCPTKDGYVGNKSKACPEHKISWSGLAKKREEEKRKRVNK
jgi:hypothetical protein